MGTRFGGLPVRMFPAGQLLRRWTGKGKSNGCGRVGHVAVRQSEHAALFQLCQDLADRHVGGVVVELCLDKGGQGSDGSRSGFFSVEEVASNFLGPVRGWGRSRRRQPRDVAER